MTRVVYNACYGGFSISKEAVLRGREITNDPKWGGVLKGETYSDGTVNDHNFGSYGRELSRTDPTLLHVIDELGSTANGSFAQLQIADIDAGTQYRIDEYDGLEAVMRISDYEWSTA